MPNNFENIWNEHTSTHHYIISEIQDRSGYSEHEIFQSHLELFMSSPGITEESRVVQHELWEDYIDAMVTGTLDRDQFFEEMGINPRDFDWESWREAMGYGRNE
jgi:hypothetical protein